MGNINVNSMAVPLLFRGNPPRDQFEAVETFTFHSHFLEESNNGLYLNDVYFPEEIIAMILSNLKPKHLLHTSLVCKKWCNIIKSDSLWANIYHQTTSRKPKKLPWYVYYCFFSTGYFDKNLIKNGNGQEQFSHWEIQQNYGDEFRVENPPVGADSLPEDIEEFNGHTSCFATSYYECNKLQEIDLSKSRLMQFIIDKYKPHIYVSEWTCGRFDCGCIYTLWCKLYKGKKLERGDEEQEAERPLVEEVRTQRVEQWAGSTWMKVDCVIKDYPPGVRRIVFQHEGRDTQFWKGHYGSKMAGGVLKLLFDSIEPLE